MITRFAPSPTGRIHVGNARTALICFLHAKKQAGKFILRIDDTDCERCKPEYVEDVKRCMCMMHLDYDSCFHQSDRAPRYREMLQQLIASGKVYPCYETPEELDLKRKMQLKQGKPPVYDREALKLSSAQVQRYVDQGRKPHFRFRLDENASVSWMDLVKGRMVIGLASLSDPIVVRSDGSYTYMLPSVVDDIDHQVTDVVRGEDHVTNTAIQIEMVKAIALGREIRFAHIPLLYDKQGKLSKRMSAMAVSDLLAQGLEPITLVNYLAKLGTSAFGHEVCSMEELIQGFDISGFSTSGAMFDCDAMMQLNCRVIQGMTFEQVAARLPMMDENFWEVVKGNIQTVDEANKWWQICKSDLSPVCTTRELLDLAAKLLEHESWDSEVWHRWVANLKSQTAFRGKELFMPLRLALTASEDGPELAKLLPLIGKARAISRLRGAVA